MPGGLSVGEYTLRLFSEQCNGDNATDYGSAFVDISLTVTGETHTVTFDMEITGNTPAAQTVGHGSRAVEPEPQIVDNMELIGWQYVPGGSTERVDFDFDTPITADMTLYAKWEQRPQLIVEASGLDYGSFTVTGNDGVVYAQNQSVNKYIPNGIQLTLSIMPNQNCTFSGSISLGGQTQLIELTSYTSSYSLGDRDVTVDLTFEKLPVLTMNVTPKNLGTGYWTVTDSKSTPTSYGDGSTIPMPSGDIISPEDILKLAITPGTYGFDGSIDNNGAVTQIVDGVTSYTFAATGPVTISLDYYERSAYHTIYFHNGDNVTATQRVAVSETAGETATATLDRASFNSSDIFSGWNTVRTPTEQDLGIAYADGAEITLSGDIHLYAQWIDAWAVTFIANGGEGSMDKYRLPKSNAIGTLSICAFTRGGYAFAGWNTKANGSGTPYADGAQITLTKSLPLYAQWTAAWTISFDPNSGEGSMADIDVAREQTAALPACAFTREGYDFAGWATSANGDKVYDDQASITPTGNCTLYALWTPHEYSITYKLDGGALPQGVTNPESYTIETPTIRLNEPVKENFTFDGWYSDAGFTKSATGIGKGSTEDKTFYAKWSELPVFGPATFTLPAFLTTVEEEAFEGAAMRIVLVPTGCTAIGDHAFRNCPNLTQIRIPAGCAIGADAFDGCTLVYIYSAAGSPAEAYCRNHTNCVFVEE